MFAQKISPERQGPGGRRLWLEGPGGARPRLLFAEDSDPVRIITAAMLKTMGCDVEAVVHGEEALRCASDRLFDVVVLDIEMPVMDGITAARSIRRLGGAHRTMPIMALSAFLADAMTMVGWDNTFDIALPKPANRNELHAAVSSALDRGSRRHVPSGVDLLDRDRLALQRGGLPEDVWRTIVEAACRDIDMCLMQMAGQGDDGSLRLLAGKLASVAATFAAPELRRLANELAEASPAARGSVLAYLRDIAEKTIVGLRSC